MTGQPVPKPEAIRRLRNSLRAWRQAKADTDRLFAEVREAAAANSSAVLGRGHPEAWTWRELDVLMGHPEGTFSGRKVVLWGLAHRPAWAKVLGRQPLTSNGRDPGGSAETKPPADPSATSRQR